ncbi:hypothetical protein L3X38_002136 [Prunus dulcis]|uniref:Uncharacterized protein n=1 Tax=Prunus dulcis TaxID=3755 RepID=A0AAD4WUX9_PRUDU|nr:hypothetical protein L3X38_002136 [Prunus dulcis]
MGPTGLAKAKNQVHPNWGWDRLAKRNQEVWDPPNLQKLKTKQTPIHLGSARKEKVRSMGPTGLVKAQNQTHPNWGWDQLAKRNQEAWDPQDWQKLKTRRIPIYLESARQEKARSMGPTRLAKAKNQAKRKQGSWGPSDRHKLKAKRTPAGVS